LNPRRLAWLCCFLWSGYVAAVAAQSVPLSSLQPAKSLSYFIKFDPSPRQKNINVPGMQGSQTASVFSGASELSYQIPAGQTTFSGLLVYPPQTRAIPGGGSYIVPMVLRMLADNKVVWEQVMDGTTPPVEFSVPVNGASVLTFKATAAFLGTEFYLVGAGFRAGAAQLTADYVVAPGAAFVDVMPQPRQALVHAYFPGEEVPVKIWYGGQAGPSQVQITVTPQWGDQPPVKNTLTLSMRELKQGLVSGSAAWKTPNWLGPAKMEVTATAGGKSVFQREVDVAVMRAVDVAAIHDNAFGVQVSTEGYPMAYNEFASLWGAKWARTFAHWAYIEPTRGKYDFSRIDSVIDTYRDQGMRFMLELGEDFPAWAGYPAPEAYLEAWKQYVAATVKHMQGRIDTWDVFNEVDNKVGTYQGKASADWDIAVLKSAVEAIHATEPGSTVICCSTGSLHWLQYDLRLAQAGVFTGVDVISLHPYQATPPEVKDGPLNYIENLAALKNLMASQGIRKPIWGSEANWMLGPAGTVDVNSPGLTEQKQAQYLSRVGMLSVALGVKYFLHSPFYTANHPQPQLPALAAFAQMSSLFSDVTQPAMLLNGPNVFAVTAEGRSGRVGGLWSVSGPATVRLEGGADYRFMDMYGNPISANPESVSLSPDPIYFTSSGAAPQAQVLSQTSVPWRTLPRPGLWTCNTAIGTNCKSTPNGLAVQSDISKWSTQLTSPAITVPANSCITLRVPIVVEKGEVFLAAMDPSTRTTVQNRKILVGPQLPGVSTPLYDLSFHTAALRSINVVVTNGNQTPAQSVFLMTAPPQIAPCQE
jgi:hypothetical protein